MLDLERKLYQLIISRLDGEKVSATPYRDRCFELVRKGIGGFIVFGGKKDEIRAFIAELQSAADIPLFVASDIERGAGQQFEGATRFPGQMAVAAAINENKPGDVKLLQDAVSDIAAEALDIGINMPLIPVLDVNRDPDNPIICTRAFSDDPEEVAWFGALYVRTLEQAGLISCAKHFPGHGDTAVDSHISLPVISKSLNALNEVDLYPFKEVIREGVSSIMIGHLSIPEIDMQPASLSEKVITGLLRKDMGYEGLVLTDALNMSALQTVESVPVQCLNAGVDILLHPADADEVVTELKEALTKRTLEERTVDAAISRILRFKSKLKDIRIPEVDYKRNAGAAQRIFDRSITLVKNTPGILPIRNLQDVTLIFSGDRENFHGSPLRNIVPDSVSIDSPFDTERKNGVVMFALFTNVAAWKGSSGIREDEISVIREIIKSSGKSVVISFGSPYVLRHFMDADVLVASYDTAEQTQMSVLKCLKGEIDFQGRLPVELKL